MKVSSVLHVEVALIKGSSVLGLGRSVGLDINVSCSCECMGNGVLGDFTINLSDVASNCSSLLPRCYCLI